MNDEAKHSTASIKDPWWSPQIDRKQLKQLMRRNDKSGLLFLGLWLALMLLAGCLVHLSLGTGWLIGTILLYGVILGFAYAASHECAHGTAFKARWLNETVFWFTSLVFVDPPTHRKYSHADHHSNTWHDEDAQKPYGNPISVWVYCKENSGFMALPSHFKLLAYHCLGLHMAKERSFTPASELPKLYRDARIFMLFYSGLIGGFAVAGYWHLPFIYFFIPRVVGGFAVSLYIASQHMCMAENIKDHRISSRSFYTTWLSEKLYWNMNYHIEHHTMPMVPFHALPAFHEKIKDQLPTANSSLWDCHRDIIRV